MKTSYVIKSKHGYVALDAASGGYPYYTESPGSIQYWTDSVAAQRYMETFKTQARIDDWVLCRAELKTVRFIDKNSLIEPPANRDVHTEHCCKDHGCKYRDDDCPVANGTKKQSYICETCDFVMGD